MVIRVVAVGDVGKKHLEILRKLSLGTRCLLTENHIVPLWGEAQFDDMTFSISPYVASNMDECYGCWAQNSVGDIVDMILQALEVGTYLIIDLFLAPDWE